VEYWSDSEVKKKFVTICNGQKYITDCNRQVNDLSSLFNFNSTAMRQGSSIPYSSSPAICIFRPLFTRFTPFSLSHQSFSSRATVKVRNASSHRRLTASIIFFSLYREFFRATLVPNSGLVIYRALFVYLFQCFTCQLHRLLLGLRINHPYCVVTFTWVSSSYPSSLFSHCWDRHPVTQMLAVLLTVVASLGVLKIIRLLVNLIHN